MTTNCDLDEVRHIAQQKFLELVESGVEWEKYSEHLGLTYCYTYRAGPWFASKAIASERMVLLLGEERVWSKLAPEPRHVRLTAKGLPDKRDAAKAEKEYQEALAAFEADPIVVAIRKIEKVHTDRECEARRKQMEDALKTSCKALQEALKDPATTLPPPTYTEHTEPYTKPTGHSESSVRKFWRDWKKARGL